CLLSEPDSPPRLPSFPTRRSSDLAVSEESTAFIWRDPVMQKTLKLAEQIAPSDASVLITGESGTGKEVMARFLHSHSKRANHSLDRKSTRLNSSHVKISYAVFCLK